MPCCQFYSWIFKKIIIDFYKCFLSTLEEGQLFPRFFFYNFWKVCITLGSVPEEGGWWSLGPVSWFSPNQLSSRIFSCVLLCHWVPMKLFPTSYTFSFKHSSFPLHSPLKKKKYALLDISWHNRFIYLCIYWDSFTLLMLGFMKVISFEYFI